MSENPTPIVWPLIHTLLVQFAPRIAEAEAAATYDERIGIINGVSAHIAKKVEEHMDAAIAALPRRDAMREALQLIANATHPRFRTEDDIDQLYANEKAFGDCINLARAALTEEPGHGA